MTISDIINTVFPLPNFIIGLTLSVIRLRWTWKVKSKQVFYRLMENHCVLDILFYWTGDLFSPLNYLAVPAYADVFLSISTIIVLHFTLSGYLALKRSTLYDNYYTYIMIATYLSPVLFNFVEILHIVTISSKSPISSGTGYIFLIIGSFFICLVTLLINYKIYRYSKKEGITIDYKNLIIFPIVQLLIWILVIIALAPSFLSNNFTVLDDQLSCLSSQDGSRIIDRSCYKAFVEIVALFPIVHFALYFPQIYRQVKQESMETSNIVSKNEIEVLESLDQLDRNSSLQNLLFAQSLSI